MPLKAVAIAAVTGRDCAGPYCSFGGFATGIAERLDVNAVKQATAIYFHARRRIASQASMAERPGVSGDGEGRPAYALAASGADTRLECRCRCSERFILQ